VNANNNACVTLYQNLNSGTFLINGLNSSDELVGKGDGPSTFSSSSKLSSSSAGSTSGVKNPRSEFKT